jgi:hypothetical protein
MKKAYFILSVSVIITAVILLIIDIFTQHSINTKPEYSQEGRFLDVHDEEYRIYPSDSLQGKWNISFPSGDLYIDLKPEQIAVFLKSGEIPMDTTWVVYPQCEYQLTMEDTTIVISDFGRPVCELPYNQTGKIAKALLKDNE